MDSARELGIDLQLYRRLIGARLRGQMQYRASFALQLVGNFLVNFAELIAILILFSHFETLGGWTVGEVAFLYGLASIAFGLAHVISAGFSTFSQQMVRGEFDRVLTRPIGAFVQTLASDLQLHRFGQVLQGLVAFGIALNLTEIDWTAGRIFYLPVIIASGVVLFVALFTIEATVSFWTVEATEAVNAFTYGGSALAQYPIHIFDAWLRRLFLFIIPVGFIVYAPSLYLLDKPDPLNLPIVTHFIAPLAATLFAVAAGLLWQFGVRHYRSTGT